VERIQALADGVFAVAMTLLVLDVRLPESVEATNHDEPWRQVSQLGPQFGAYPLSFTTLGTFWLAQHTLLSLCERSDRMLARATLAYLFFVSTLPFSASTLASHVHLSLAVGLYWVNLFGLGATMAWQIEHMLRARLSRDPDAVTLVRRRLGAAQVLYAVGALVSLLNGPRASSCSRRSAALYRVAEAARAGLATCGPPRQ